MQHTAYANAIRYAMRAAMGADAWTRATLARPDRNAFSDSEPQTLGKLNGYRYIRHSHGDKLHIDLPGAISDAHGSEWFMDLTPCLPLNPMPGDLLRFENGDARRIVMTCGSGAFCGRDIYRLYELEAV